MLKLTTSLYEKTAASAGTGDVGGWTTAFKRGGALGMLGVNTRGSTIVLADDEHAGAEGGAYAAAAPGRVQAGYRAPDAPGLVGADETTVRLFDVFGPAAHTVLVFGGDVSAHGAVKHALACWPKGTEHTMLISRAGEKEESTVLREVLEDREGHAHAEYASDMTEGGMTIVIVRPDGVVGAVVSQAEGIERYGKLIFG
jgi:hypothetical protein